MGNNGIKIFTGNANPRLAESIVAKIGMDLGAAEVSRFSEGEIRVKIQEDVRGRDVYVIQPTCPPPNDNLMELLILIDALRRASATRITAVLPYYGYARQDRKDQPRVPITAKLVANLLTASGVNRILTIDLHAQQIQGFFDIPVDHLYSFPVFIDYIKKLNLKNLVIVSPDVGGIKMARAYSTKLGAELAIVDKRRLNDKEAMVMNLLGDVKNKAVIIVDDLLATAGSLTEAAQILKEKGAASIRAAVAHPILSGPAHERLAQSCIEELMVTDTIPVDPSMMKKLKNITVLSVDGLLAEAILRIHKNESISSLFI